MFSRIICVSLYIVLISQAASAKSPYPLAELGKKRFKLDHGFHSEVSAVGDAEYSPILSPEPEYHAFHYRIKIELPAISGTHPSFEGEEEITLVPLHSNFRVLKLDSSGLDIKKINLLNTFENLQFEQSGDQVWIDLNHEYGPDDPLVLTINYVWNNFASKGVYFKSRTGKDGIEAIYSQSEEEESKYWFLGNSHPNDRSTFEALIRVPAPFVAISNGSLVDFQEDSKTRMRLYHWSEGLPMPSYLFVMTAGLFGVYREEWNGIPVEYYGPADDMDRTRTTLSHTPAMLDFFSERIGFRYPYEKYAQALVPQFTLEGMEHTTATTLTDKVLDDPAADSLISHELSHQWFGDLITCKRWNDTWLNEGFASYFQALNDERTGGEDALNRSLAEARDWFFSEDDVESKPVVFGYYKKSLDDLFDSHTYAKGAWVLHMLRRFLGDEVFFRGIHHYVLKFQGKLVETSDFISVMQEAAGRDLGWFFDEWLSKPGYPVFSYHWSYDEKAKEVVLWVKQIQDLTHPGGVAGTTPIYVGPMDVDVDGTRFQVSIDGPEQVYRLTAIRKPSEVIWNSRKTWLAKVQLEP